MSLGVKFTLMGRRGGQEGGDRVEDFLECPAGTQEVSKGLE